MLLIFAITAFVYLGGKYVPAELKRYKEIILGIAIGCLVCCATGMEGMEDFPYKKKESSGSSIQSSGSSIQSSGSSMQSSGSSIQSSDNRIRSTRLP